MDDRKPISIDEEEYEAAVKDAESSQDVFVHNFAKPFTFEGESFDSLSFNFANLTGADSLAIENEMSGLGLTLVAAEFSGEFLIRMAARACTTLRADGRKLGADAFRALPIKAFTRIRNRCRSFLLSAES